MPFIENSSYKPPRFLTGAHLETIFPSLFRRVKEPSYRRERIEIPDGDFLDLDWSGPKSERLVILCHGLEGSSEGAYIKGMANAFNQEGWQALAWNFRGCSGEDNRLFRSYHSGATEDLHHVVSHALKKKHIKEIVLLGFSLGGNMTLKYVGEKGSRLSKRIKKAVAFSVPCDLQACSHQLARPGNRIYMWRFMRTLKAKSLIRSRNFPEQLDTAPLLKMKTFLEFDDYYTAPAHGFQDAVDYWTSCSSRQFLSRIRIPTLLVNAHNDPFLAPSCYPVQEARNSSSFFLEIPRRGGHVGFAAFKNKGRYWSESRALEFIQKGA